MTIALAWSTKLDFAQSEKCPKLLLPVSSNHYLELNRKGTALKLKVGQIELPPSIDPDLQRKLLTSSENVFYSARVSKDDLVKLGGLFQRYFEEAGTDAQLVTSGRGGPRIVFGPSESGNNWPNRLALRMQQNARQVGYSSELSFNLNNYRAGTGYFRIGAVGVDNTYNLTFGDLSALRPELFTSAGAHELYHWQQYQDWVAQRQQAFPNLYFYDPYFSSRQLDFFSYPYAKKLRVAASRYWQVGNGMQLDECGAYFFDTRVRAAKLSEIDFTRLFGSDLLSVFEKGLFALDNWAISLIFSALTIEQSDFAYQSIKKGKYEIVNLSDIPVIVLPNGLEMIYVSISDQKIEGNRLPPQQRQELLEDLLRTQTILIKQWEEMVIFWPQFKRQMVSLFTHIKQQKVEWGGYWGGKVSGSTSPEQVLKFLDLLPTYFPLER